MLICQFCLYLIYSYWQWPKEFSFVHLVLAVLISALQNLTHQNFHYQYPLQFINHFQGSVHGNRTLLEDSTRPMELWKQFAIRKRELYIQLRSAWEKVTRCGVQGHLFFGIRVNTALALKIINNLIRRMVFTMYPY